MKKILKTGLIAIAVMATTNIYAQTSRDTTLGDKIENTAEKVGDATERTAKKVGNKTAEIAAKGAAAVVDKKYDGKAGPNGEVIYINDKSEYYYVNKEGKRVYLTEAQLHNKPSN